MKSLILIACLVLLSTFAFAKEQEEVYLPLDKNNQSTDYWMDERQFYSAQWKTDVITNVKTPSLLVFRPPKNRANNVGIVIAPGGGFYGLSISSEGAWPAQWLAERGYTVFVLKYRLVPTGEDGVEDQGRDWNSSKAYKKIRKIMPLSHTDAHHAMREVRQNASEYGIDKNKIGMLGFSAGGTVVMSLTYTNDLLSKPNFIGLVYPWMTPLSDKSPPENAASIFIAAASDDELNLAPESISLYQDWIRSGLSAELHVYKKGGHGFGYKNNSQLQDIWITQFESWLQTLKY